MTSEPIICQENISASNVAGRDIHNHQYQVAPYTELDALIQQFKEDSKGDTADKPLLDDLHHLSTRVQNEKVIGLAAKLAKAGRDLNYVQRSEECKERFAKRLYKHTFSESAQKIYLYLLLDVSTRFQFRILPHIQAGATSAEIDALIDEEVIEPVSRKLGPHKFVLDVYAREIAGMLFFLTGNCHLDWAP